MRPGDPSPSRMKLRFLGTRGEIEARTWWHRISLPLVSYRGINVMIDCGLDWLGKFKRLHPDAIVLTHRIPIRKRGERLIGHAAISVQIGWVAKQGEPRTIITHCRSEIVTGDDDRLAARLRDVG